MPGTGAALPRDSGAGRGEAPGAGREQDQGEVIIYMHVQQYMDCLMYALLTVYQCMLTRTGIGRARGCLAAAPGGEAHDPGPDADRDGHAGSRVRGLSLGGAHCLTLQETTRQIEIDSDREILSIKNKYERLLKDERDGNMRLKVPYPPHPADVLTCRETTAFSATSSRP